MVCQILLRDQEQLLSTFYFLSVPQEVCRTSVGEYWQFTRLGLLSLLTVTVRWCNQQWCKVIASERPPELKPFCPNHAFLRGCYCLHKNTQNALYICSTSLPTHLQTEIDTKGPSSTSCWQTHLHSINLKYNLAMLYILKHNIGKSLNRMVGRG